jgi:hypothetical protein
MRYIPMHSYFLQEHVIVRTSELKTIVASS